MVCMFSNLQTNVGSRVLVLMNMIRNIALCLVTMLQISYAEHVACYKGKQRQYHVTNN